MSGRNGRLEETVMTVISRTHEMPKGNEEMGREEEEQEEKEKTGQCKHGIMIRGNGGDWGEWGLYSPG